MAERSIVVTGASSYLGQSLVKQLISGPGARVTAFVSPRSGSRDRLSATDRVAYIETDLTDALSAESESALALADSVFHLAWQRGADLSVVSDDNLRMIENVLVHLSDPRKFLFFSSVAAARNAPSVYGVAKWRAENLVRERGGCVLVCGLVVDDHEPGSAYQEIQKLVCNFPLDIHFLGSQPNVYIIALADLLGALESFVILDEEPRTYGLFLPSGTPLRELLLAVKRRCPRLRIPVPMHVSAVGTAARALHLTPWKMLGERLLTFLFDNRERLQDVESLPTAELEATMHFLTKNPQASMKISRT